VSAVEPDAVSIFAPYWAKRLRARADRIEVEFNTFHRIMGFPLHRCDEMNLVEFQRQRANEMESGSV
jgi:hypothetical protein